MNCKNCGSPITEFDKFCQNCGTPTELKTEEQEVSTPSEEVVAAAEPVAEEVNQSASIEPVQGVQTPAPSPVAKPAEPIGEVQTPVEPKKKSNVGFILIVIFLGLVILGVGVFILFRMFGDRLFNKPVDSPVVEDKIDDKTDPEPTTVENNETYSVNGYNFTIPTGFIKIENNGKDYIGNGNFYFGFVKVTNSYKYDDLKSQLSNLATTYTNKVQTDGLTYIGNNEYTYGNRKFLIISYYYQSVYTDLILTELSDKTILSSYVYYTSTSYKEDGYKKLAAFADSAKKDEASSFSLDSNDKDTFSSAGTLSNKVKFE